MATKSGPGQSTEPDSMCIAAYRSFFKRALTYGITSVQDMASSLNAERTMRTLQEAGPPIRWRVIRFPGTDAKGRLRDEWMKMVSPANSLIKISGTKWVLDGTQIEQFAVMREPYSDRSDWYGHLYFPVDTIRLMIAESLAGSDPLLLHAIGDSTINIILHTMSQLASDSLWCARRVRIEHGNFMKPDQYKRVKELGITIVTNPSHYERVDPVRSLLGNGIPLAIGSDGPTNPFLNIMLAVTHDEYPTEAISREQAVLAYTAGSAYAEFAENEKGKLSTGMFADLAVLSQDIFTIPIQELPQTESILTMVGGNIVFHSGIIKVKEDQDK